MRPLGKSARGGQPAGSHRSVIAYSHIQKDGFALGKWENTLKAFSGRPPVNRSRQISRVNAAAHGEHLFR
jgi:hypothetical protein